MWPRWLTAAERFPIFSHGTQKEPTGSPRAGRTAAPLRSAPQQPAPAEPQASSPPGAAARAVALPSRAGLCSRGSGCGAASPVSSSASRGHRRGHCQGRRGGASQPWPAPGSSSSSSGQLGTGGAGRRTKAGARSGGPPAGAPPLPSPLKSEPWLGALLACGRSGTPRERERASEREWLGPSTGGEASR